MKILITGANGYIGKSLSNTFKDKHKVYTISRDQFDLTNSNNLHSFFLSNGHFDVVIHCAVFGGGRLKDNCIEVLDNNLIMYYNLLSNKKYFDRFISFGSGAEIFAQDTYYGLSKHIIRQSMLVKNNFYNIRIYGVFDENELETRFIKANMKRYINHKSMEIYEDKYMDVFYMKDLITLVEHYMETPSENLPQEIDCTYLKTSTLSEISEFINGLNDYKVDIKITKIKPQYSGKYTDIGLKYIGLEQGIIEMYNKLKKQ